VQVREAYTGLLTTAGFIVIQSGSSGPEGPGNPGETAGGAFLLPGRPLDAAEAAGAVGTRTAGGAVVVGGRKEDDESALEGRED